MRHQNTILLNFYYIPESFNTNISQQHFDIITFVNSQHEKTNSKGDFVLKKWFETLILKISGTQT